MSNCLAICIEVNFRHKKINFMNFSFVAGDVLMIKPRNRKEVVDEFFSRVKWDRNLFIKVSENWPGTLCFLCCFKVLWGLLFFLISFTCKIYVALYVKTFYW